MEFMLAILAKQRSAEYGKGAEKASAENRKTRKEEDAPASCPTSAENKRTMMALTGSTDANL